MKLYYFDINDTPEVLKNKRNDLVKKHHPDKAPEHPKAAKTEIMKRINAEYEFLLKKNRQSKLKEQSVIKHTSSFSPESIRQVQDFYNAIISSNYLLIITSVMQVNNWKEVCEIFYHSYKIPLLTFLAKKIPAKELKMVLKLLPNQ